jgi:hypothetical protein
MEYCEGAPSRLTACSKLPGPEPVRLFLGRHYALQSLLKMRMEGKCRDVRGTYPVKNLRESTFGAWGSLWKERSQT